MNDRRLYFDAVDLQSAVGDPLHSGLFAIDADGKEAAKLIQRRMDERVMGAGATGRGILRPWYRFLQIADDGSDDVFVTSHEYSDETRPEYTKLMRLNTRTRGIRNITPLDAPDYVQSWILDQSIEPRVAIANGQGDRSLVHGRDTQTGKWTELNAFDMMAPAASDILPEAVDAQGQLYVTALDPSTLGGERTRALFRMSPKADALPDKLLLTLKGYDFQGSLQFDRQSTVYFVFERVSRKLRLLASSQSTVA